MISSAPSTPKQNMTTVIKIKSPKSDVKVYVPYFTETPKIAIVPPELTLRGTQPSNDDDKITQAWNRLKVNALSKAIAMAPVVGRCSFTDHPELEEDWNDSTVSDAEKPDLSKAVTSTPMKPKKYFNESDPTNRKNKSYGVNREKSYSTVGEELSELESLRQLCLDKIEMQVRRCAQRKKNECLKLQQENDERIKEKLAALKIELDREQLVRIQRKSMVAQQMLMEAKATEQRAEELQQSKVDHEKRIAETGEKLKQIEQKRKELEEKDKERREELKKCISGVHQMQIAYGEKYNHITEMTKKCKDIRMLNEKVSSEIPKLKSMNEQLLRLVEKCKEGKVNTADLRAAECLVQQISVVSDLFFTHTDEINRVVEKANEEKKREQAIREQKAQTEEAERQEKEKEESQKAEKEKKRKAKQREERVSSGIDDCISGESLKWHLELSRFLEQFEDKLQPLLTNDSLKKFRFDCQKIVNVPVNAISPLDDLHLEDKRYKLCRMLQGQAVPIGNTLFLVTGHPLGIPFCTNLLAKKFVKQGELTVSSKPEAAFAIAAVIVALWVDFPEFGRLLMAHFHRECPYLIPAFLPQVEGQTNEDYYKMLGYEYSEDGRVESQDKFLRRMSGVMRLYAAVLVTPVKRSQAGKTHPLGIREAWRWLAASLNLRPRPDISATLLFDLLEVAGSLLYRTYGLQFTKLLHVLCADYFPLIEQVTPDGCSGPVVRLKSFLEKILKEGQVPLPAGLLPPNFW